MSRIPDEHERLQGLISARLDGALSAGDDQELSEHLAKCATCRVTYRDYRNQRNLLAALPAPPPPRDLWARTCAALDREMARAPRASARGGARGGGPTSARPAPGSRWLGLTAATSVLLAAVVVATQLNATVRPDDATNQPGGRPTPFEVTPQDIAVFDFTARGLSVYQTRVSEACPQPAIDCTSIQLQQPVLQIRGNGSTNRGLAVSWRSGRLALVAGDESGSETISVVSLPPYPPTGGDSNQPSHHPAASGSEQTLGVQTPSAPSASRQGPPVATPSHIAGSTTDATPSRVEPSRRPTIAPPIAPGTPPITTSPSASPAPDRSHPATAPPSNAVAPATSPGSRPSDESLPSEASPAPSVQPAEGALSIVEGVRLAGAAPAWSIEGDMLAFSAMPADLSSGPDVYLWRVGEPKARRVTNDHHSYFASWSQGRVVVSRPDAPGNREKRASPNAEGPDVDTVVIDLPTGEERLANGPRLWLPTVDPGARYAVAWVGSLHVDGDRVTPGAGGLYLVDWHSMDPFAVLDAAADGSGTSPSPSASPPELGARASPSASSSSPSRSPHLTQIPVQPARSTRKPRASPQPKASPTAASARPTPTEVSATATDARPTTTGEPEVTSVTLQSIEPGRDENTDPVLDWVVRWSADGTTVGVWVADTAGANWGRLAVMRVSLQASQFAREAVLGPNLAQRAFSMGTDRVAWVAPSADSAEGELRVRTWDAHGYGDVRIHTLDAGGGVPAF